MLMDATAAELADDLEAMKHHPHNTGGLSMLDEATISFGRKSAEIAEAQQAFATARYAHMRSYSSDTGNYSDEAWQNAMAAAQRLAAALRPLGDVSIARCQERTGWGTCTLPLNDQGQCSRTDEHISGEE